MQREKRTFVLSFFLLLLFVGTQTMQALHFHGSEAHGKQLQQKAGNQYHLVKNEVNCAICDYNHHRAQQYYLDFDPLLTLNKVDVALPAFKSPYFLKLYEASVHSWTNKGPPSLS